MKDFSEVNFFTDPGLVANPYPYYEYLRAQCPVVHVPSSGVVAIARGPSPTNRHGGATTLRSPRTG